MFNLDFAGNNNTKVSFNAPCTGIIQRSNPKSRFKRFHSHSKLAELVFSDNPRLTENKFDDDYKPIKILQLMVFGDEEILMEFIFEEDLK